ncbi:MAG: pyruvate, phosphate dikinase [Kiritimatiellae bacterium]|nr:pyruvate, phosphate dikinase [Kiritimatiellia bacterium]
MMQNDPNLSTGLPGLDDVVQGLREGDNVVWQVDGVEQYNPIAKAFVAESLRRGRRVVYFRFATHEPLIMDRAGVERFDLEPAEGFEAFVSTIHNEIVTGGRETVYVFDCLSDLAADWCSDRMLGNFYMLICPYVYDHGGAAYFALLRDHHSFHATDPVRQTTQILVDIYEHRERVYVHPQKVLYRHTSTMFALHAQQDDRFVPVATSAEIADVFSGKRWNRLDRDSWRRGYWSARFAEAEDLCEPLVAGSEAEDDVRALKSRLCRMLIARGGSMLALAERHLDLADLLAIRNRMIGTGRIGGKSAGLVLAQAVLRKASEEWDDILETPDCFFIGADVFYTFLVQNGMWWIKQQQKDPDHYLDGLPLARHQLLNGQFPAYIMQQFEDLLGYFGQAPFIVRSSSLLEDDFKSSFAGKGESVICTNRGTLEQRMEELVSSVRRVYASNMSAESLSYRAARGSLNTDEQMAILIQRLSGNTVEQYHFPHVAGVGLSYNPYVWDRRIDPEAGVLRLVFGLGTRAVDVHPDDYTRVVALNEPDMELCEVEEDGARQTQQHVDVLDLDSGHVQSMHFSDMVRLDASLPLGFVASQDRRLSRLARERPGSNINPWVVDLGGLLHKTDFAARMSTLLKTLGQAYESPVDVEFAASISDDGTCCINLLQCRPFLTSAVGHSNADLAAFPSDQCLLQSSGPVIGESREQPIDCLVYVVPEAYGKLAPKDRYAVARAIGSLMATEQLQSKRILLLGPGRWGTGSPSLGVPTGYADLQGAAAIGEIAAMHQGLTPDPSLGSHFFHELVEMKILYFALFPGKDGHRIDEGRLEEHDSMLAEILPTAKNWASVIKVLEPSGSAGEPWCLRADVMRQIVILTETACT